jgi:hypothetical protein
MPFRSFCLQLACWASCSIIHSARTPATKNVFDRDHGDVRQARRRFLLPSVVDGIVDLVTHQLGGEVMQGLHFAVAHSRDRAVMWVVDQDELDLAQVLQ